MDSIRAWFKQIIMTIVEVLGTLFFLYVLAYGAHSIWRDKVLSGDMQELLDWSFKEPEMNLKSK